MEILCQNAKKLIPHWMLLLAKSKAPYWLIFIMSNSNVRKNNMHTQTTTYYMHVLFKFFLYNSNYNILHLSLRKQYKFHCR